jgi:hypothetical protein
MSFELHNKKESDFECKYTAHILYLEYQFFYVDRYGGDFVYGSRYSDIQVFCLLFFWPLERYKVTSMHNVHNATHLLMN